MTAIRTIRTAPVSKPRRNLPMSDDPSTPNVPRSRVNLRFMLRTASALLVVAAVLAARTPPDLNECLDALARSAANFAASAPGLMAEETLDQRGRRGFIEILTGKKNQVKDLDFTLPDDFHSHHVVSNYGLVEIGDARVLHE